MKLVSLNLPRVNDPESRTCYFCSEARVMTREHVYPQWIWREHGDGEAPPAVVAPGPHRSLENIEFFETEDYEGLFRYHSPVGDRPVIHATALISRRVCAECNNGWMADLEREMAGAVRRVLSGRAWRPTEDQFTTFRRWAAKTGVMAESTELDVALAGQDVRSAIMNGEELPGSWYFGLARVVRQAAFSVEISPVVLTVQTRDDLGDDADGEDAEADRPPLPSPRIYMTQYMIAIERLLLIARYSPFPLRHPSRLDHDLINNPRGRPPSFSRTAPLQPIRIRDLPLMTEANVDDFHFWGHAVNPRRGLLLLGGPDGPYIGSPDLLPDDTFHPWDE